MADYMTFNEQNYLCHYGIKGMKWGIRRYQNPDGSLTSAGKARYGSIKGLKKYIRSENKKAHALGTAGATIDRAVDRARTRQTKYEEKIEKRQAKGRDTSKLELKAKAAAESRQELEKRQRKAHEAIEKQYKDLVKEFGKENVNAVTYDSHGNISDGVTRGKKITTAMVATGLTIGAITAAPAVVSLGTLAAAGVPAAAIAKTAGAVGLAAAENAGIYGTGAGIVASSVTKVTDTNKPIHRISSSARKMEKNTYKDVKKKYRK